ncbi:hypothetical protein DVW64_14690 [Enterococcus faecium]|nr:hypothetical protein DVW64_14690 [Enterococcus faecium]
MHRPIKIHKISIFVYQQFLILLSEYFLKVLLVEFEKRTVTKVGSIIYGTDESELILQPHFHFRY